MAEPTQGSQYAIRFGVFFSASRLFCAIVLWKPVTSLVIMQVITKVEKIERSGDEAKSSA
jgi:hypothetical protein